MVYSPKSNLPNQTNDNLELAFVSIARELYDFIEVEEDADEIQRVQPILYDLLNSSNHYHNATGGLHPDLGLALREWAILKQEYLIKLTNSTLSKQQIEIDRYFIDAYGQSAQKIIEYLEDLLGLNNQPDASTKHEPKYPESRREPVGSLPPYVGVIAGTNHIASFRTGGPTGDHTLIADGDFSDDNDGFNGDDEAPGYDHFGSKY